ncbi:MAG: amidohydrolase family protein [Woeseiaceae bacterium]|nr:amidohydrolase family protein [Woeseiaceae bacterium]
MTTLIVRPSVVLTAALLITLLSACGQTDPASLIVQDARIWTGNPDQPWAEALAVRGDTIIAVGGIDDVTQYADNSTDVIEGNGGMLVPGFIDTHVHFVTGGSGLASVQLRDAATPDEFGRRIAEFAAGLEPGEWILNGTWDHENWGGELPHRDWIDALTPDHPVWVFRLDGHMALANSRALELAGVDADTPDIAGGEIVRDEAGRPTGILKDNAMALVEDVVPPPGDEQMDRQLDAAMAHVAANGVTSVHDMAGWASLSAARRAQADDRLITRLYSVVPLSDWPRLRDEVAENGRGDDWLRIGGVKGFMDGSTGLPHRRHFLSRLPTRRMTAAS